MAGQISILLLSHSSSRLNSIEDIFVDSQSIVTSRRLLSGNREVSIANNPSLPDAVVLDLSDNWQNDLDDYLQSDTALSGTPLVVIGDSDDPVVLRRAMQAGARDYFYSPVSSEELYDSVTQVGSETKRKKRQNSGIITAVMNGKGGSGATFLSTGLAAVLGVDKRRRSASCVVVDLDLQFGNLPVYFDLSCNDNLTHALQSVDSLDTLALQGMVQHYGSTNVHILASHPDGFRQDTGSLADKAQRLLQTLAASYDHVIVDVPRNLDPVGISAIESADQILLTLQQSVPNLRDTRYLFGLIESLGVSSRTVSLIINRYEKSNNISLNDILGAYPELKYYTVPNDFKRVSYAANNGVPIPFKWPSSTIAKSLHNIANDLWPVTSALPEKPKLQRLFSLG